jgi:putative endonuclease
VSRAEGDRAEDSAQRALRRAGYKILDRNYTVRGGELDLVAEHQGVICFVEVRARATSEFGAPEETIGPAKRRRLTLAARHWLMTKAKGEPPCRFDVVAIEGDRIRIYQDAFRLND